MSVFNKQTSDRVCLDAYQSALSEPYSPDPERGNVCREIVLGCYTEAASHDYCMEMGRELGEIMRRSTDASEYGDPEPAFRVDGDMYYVAIYPQRKG